MTSYLKYAGLLSIGIGTAMLPGCGASNENSDDDGNDSAASFEQQELGQTEQGVMSCSNPDGTNSVMAALAVATAQDLKRWQPSKDFQVFNTNGQSESASGPQQAIKLTSMGKSRCSDGKCVRVQALLDMQYEPANGKVKFPGGIVLSPSALRSRLVAKLNEQKTCEARPQNGGSNSNCPVEEHQLTFQRASKGSCDTNFFFRATATNGAALKYPAQLKNKLLWVDVQNPYVAFQNVGDIVSIDPTWGLNEDGTSSAGNCSPICTKISPASLAGQCCSCNGVTSAYARSAWNAVTFLCQ